MRTLEVDVIATRGADIESCHRVHAAVVGADGDLVAEARQSGILTSWRSCAKPFQAMPLIESGTFDELGWADDQLALACASHGGEPEHVAIARRMLEDLGLEEGDLACGPHEPLSARGAKILRDAGEHPSRLHNNCSGKHAAMLAHADAAGWSLEGYEKEGHPVQQGNLHTVSEWSAVPENDIHRAIDGCGVVVFATPLVNLATAYARFARSIDDAHPAVLRIANAMRRRPFLVGGTDRFDTVLMEETDGRVVCKVGAEGVHAVAVPDRKLGIAVKVEDGAQRAQYPALLRILQMLDVLPAELPERLDEYVVRPIRNTRNEVVGEVRAIS